MYVRDADPEDAERVAALARESWHAAYGEFLSTTAIDATVDEWYAPESLRRDIGGDGAFLVAEGETTSDADGAAEDAERSLLGFAHAAYSEGVGNVVLRRIYVRPAAWGEGVGTTLVRAVARRFVDDYDRLSAVVLANNEVGRSFYDSLSFEEIGRQTTTFGDEQRAERIVAADLSTLAGPDGGAPERV